MDKKDLEKETNELYRVAEGFERLLPDLKEQFRKAVCPPDFKTGAGQENLEVRYLKLARKLVDIASKIREYAGARTFGAL